MEPLAAGAQPLVSAGAQQAERPEQLADADVLITMLADDAATQQVVVDSGLLQRMKPGALHINMATISVELAKRLTALHAEHGIGYLAAPVLGRVDVAAAGKLNILAAGDSELLKQAQPLFDALGQKTGTSAPIRRRPTSSKSPPTLRWPAPLKRWRKAARWCATTACPGPTTCRC